MLIFDQLKRNDPALRLLSLTVLCGIVMLLAGLWWVQVVSSRYYEEKLETQSFRSVRIPAVRGRILDRNGIALVENHASYSASIYLEELSGEFQRNFAQALAEFRRQHDRRPNRSERSALARSTRYHVTSNIISQVGARLNAPLSLDPAVFQRHYDRDLAIPLPVAANLDTTQLARFQEQGATPAGVDLDVHAVRVYPYATTAAHLLGYVRRDDSSAEGEEAFFNHRLPDFKGVVGIESLFDNELRGKAGAKSVLVNHLGYRQSETIWAEAEPGKNVVLTIDLPIQRASEQALARLGPQGPHTRGAVVVMDVNSGDVLAMVSSPAYDPNRFVQGMSREEWTRLTDAKLRPQFNRATHENYAPGSIFKTVVGLAALEAGLNPNQTYIVEPDPSRPGRGCIYVGNRKIEDTAPPGEYNFRRAIKLSSNAYFITNGIRAGMSSISKLAQQFHLGEPTGLLPRQEARGTFPSAQRLRSRWFDGDTANICIGQGEIAVTPLQIAVMTSAIANGGKVFYPRIVDRLESQDFSSPAGMVFPKARLRDELNVRPQNLLVLREAMLADVEDSDATGRRAAVPGFRVSGKTGTAQVMNERNQKIDQTTWFASFAPYENPRYAVVVMVESGASGGDTCAPIAGEIYRAIQKREQSPQTIAQTQ